MAITNTTLAQDNHDQADGSRYVREFHTDSAGKVHRFEYLWRAPMDRSAIASARAVQLAEMVAQREAEQAVEVDATPQIVQQTGTQFLARLRALYHDSAKDQSARLARWIAHRIDAGDVTVAQLRAAFGLSAGQWTTLEAKMRDLASKLDALDAAQGE